MRALLRLAAGIRSRPVALAKAHVVAPSGPARSLRFDRRVLALDAAPARDDLAVDLGGAFVFPGLINGHDHLELNHYGRVKFRAAYRNASEWVDDLRPRLQSDPHLRAGQRLPLADRLFIGGLKNLLSGATTVAHHNPLYAQLRFGFPARLVRRYGWAHSLYLQGRRAGANGEQAGDVGRRYRATPRSAPFCVHLAEGVDEAARSELAALEALGALAANTVLIHGVGLGADEWGRVAERGGGLVWCPASNLFLFGRTAPVRQFMGAGPESAARICLGTDSRLTGSRDLLAEMRVAAEAGPMAAREVFDLATVRAADLFRLGEAGRLASGLPADLFVLPRLADDPFAALLSAERRDLALVVIGGRPLYGAPDMCPVFAVRGVETETVTVDGAEKLLARPLARRLARGALGEAGVEVA